MSNDGSTAATPNALIKDGKSRRAASPRRDHAIFEPSGARPDPVALLEEQAQSRVPELIPIRYGRMLVSPFAFFRGAALIMASDLANTPTSGLTVQACGDAHLSNFGLFASPERQLVFDLNDFDETLPGPWEWDVKRLAASLAIAGRERGFSTSERRKIVRGTTRSYRRAMHDFAGMSDLAVWYARLPADQALVEFGKGVKTSGVKQTEAMLAKARSRDSQQALDKLTTVVGGERRIISDPPLIVPVEELVSVAESAELLDQMHSLLTSYSRSLSSDRRVLLSRFELVQMARKVVGVGSVGTRAWILLMRGRDDHVPLFLQAKEADRSVLERFTRASQFANNGERIVAGQRLMQAASDIFLGWDRVTGFDGNQRDFYIRQLRDWKGSAEVDRMAPQGLASYGRMCGWVLARAHARSGSRFAIASYLGTGAVFDDALAEFAESYADQNEADYNALKQAVAEGRVVAETGL